MPATEFEFGNTIRVRATFFASAVGVQVPASAWLAIRSPEYLVGTDYLVPTQWATVMPFFSGASIANPATAAYYSDFVASIAGQWWYAYYGYVGGAWFREQDSFRVQTDRVL